MVRKMYSERSRAKLITILIAVMLFGICRVVADTVWTSGHHVILDGDLYSEIWMYNDSRVTMFGGDVFKLEAFDVTLVDILSGELTDLRLHDNSIGDLYGGVLDRLGIVENGLLNLYAYDVTYYETGGHYDRGWIEGRYLGSDLYFSFDFVEPDTFSHITVIPEPGTFLLVCLGCMLVRRRY